MSNLARCDSTGDEEGKCVSKYELCDGYQDKLDKLNLEKDSLNQALNDNEESQKKLKFWGKHNQCSVSSKPSEYFSQVCL